MRHFTILICTTVIALFGTVTNTASREQNDCPKTGYFHNCFGYYKWSDGDEYIGDWVNDRPHGHGVFSYASGSNYIGEFKQSLRHGQGTYTWPNGDTYVGEYKDNLRHGQGTYTYADGEKYVGSYKKDDRTGYGTYSWPNGDTYVGEWLNNLLHGQGTYTYANGEEYVGEWLDDYKNGQGTYTWLNGEKYVGGYKNDNRNGYGTYSWPDGATYVGEYKDNLRHGQGTYTYADGTIEEGIFENGELLYAKKLTPEGTGVETPSQVDEVIAASSGSGFSVSSDGYIITNHHVIDGCNEVMVHTKGKQLTVDVVTYDQQNDLALLKGDFNPKVVFSLSSKRPELLQDIYVAGFPFGDSFSTTVKVTKGIISSLTGLGNNFSNMQIDAALQSGNSGGPILDDFGNVIGVAVAKLDAKYMFDEFGIIPENTNFGIKSSVVSSILDSQGVEAAPPNQRPIRKSELGKMITDGTYYISCMMTLAQIEKIRSDKVLFSTLDQ